MSKLKLETTTQEYAAAAAAMEEALAKREAANARALQLEPVRRRNAHAAEMQKADQECALLVDWQAAIAAQNEFEAIQATYKEALEKYKDARKG